MEFKVETSVEVPQQHELVSFPFDEMKAPYTDSATGKKVYASFQIPEDFVSRARYQIKALNDDKENVRFFRIHSDKKNQKEGDPKLFRVFRLK